MVVISDSGGSGGIKGFLSRAATSASTAKSWVLGKGLHYGQKMGRTAMGGSVLVIVVFFPLILEIAREKEVIQIQKLEVQQLKKEGVNDMVLQQMGFAKEALFQPSVLENK